MSFVDWLRRIEMEMRIVSGDSESARALADALTAAFGDDRVSLRRDRPSVEVRVRGGSDRTVLRVLDTVDRWLGDAGSRSAEMWLGERSYRFGPWATTQLWQ
jgi:hypothetical protein